MMLFLVVFGILILLFGFWLPTFIALKIRKKSLKESIRILFFEVLWVVLLVIGAEVCGLTNPGAYMLLSMVLVSIGGCVYVLLKRKPSEVYEK